MSIKLEDWKNAIVMEGFVGLINALSLRNAVFLLDLNNYIQVNSILGFDCMPSGNNLGCDQISIPVNVGRADYSILLIFANNLKETAQLFVLSEFLPELEAIMTVDKNGQADIKPSV